MGKVTTLTVRNTAPTADLSKVIEGWGSEHCLLSDAWVVWRMILASFNPKAIRQGRPTLIAIAVAAAVVGVAVVVLPGGAAVDPAAKTIATIIAVVSSAAIARYCFTILAHLKPNEPAVWTEGRVLLARSPHLSKLALDRSVTIQTVSRRSFYGPFDELIVTNGQGEKLSIHGLYMDRAVSDLAARILAVAA